jgi:hypothetical protein
MRLGPKGQAPTPSNHWVLTNTQGSSAADLSRVIFRNQARDAAGFGSVRIAATLEALKKAKPIAGTGPSTDF